MFKMNPKQRAIDDALYLGEKTPKPKKKKKLKREDLLVRLDREEKERTERLKKAKLETLEPVDESKKRTIEGVLLKFAEGKYNQKDVNEYNQFSRDEVDYVLLTTKKKALKVGRETLFFLAREKDLAKKNNLGEEVEQAIEEAEREEQELIEEIDDEASQARKRVRSGSGKVEGKSLVDRVVAPDVSSETENPPKKSEDREKERQLELEAELQLASEEFDQKFSAIHASFFVPLKGEVFLNQMAMDLANEPDIEKKIQYYKNYTKKFIDALDTGKLEKLKSAVLGTVAELGIQEGVVNYFDAHDIKETACEVSGNSLNIDIAFDTDDWVEKLTEKLEQIQKNKKTVEAKSGRMAYDWGELFPEEPALSAPFDVGEDKEVLNETEVDTRLNENIYLFLEKYDLVSGGLMPGSSLEAKRKILNKLENLNTPEQSVKKQKLKKTFKALPLFVANGLGIFFECAEGEPAILNKEVVVSEEEKKEGDIFLCVNVAEENWVQQLNDYLETNYVEYQDVDMEVEVGTGVDELSEAAEDQEDQSESYRLQREKETVEDLIGLLSKALPGCKVLPLEGEMAKPGTNEFKAAKNTLEKLIFFVKERETELDPIIKTLSENGDWELSLVTSEAVANQETGKVKMLVDILKMNDLPPAKFAEKITGDFEFEFSKIVNFKFNTMAVEAMDKTKYHGEFTIQLGNVEQARKVFKNLRQEDLDFAFNLIAQAYEVGRTVFTGYGGKAVEEIENKSLTINLNSSNWKQDLEKHCRLLVAEKQRIAKIEQEKKEQAEKKELVRKIMAVCSTVTIPKGKKMLFKACNIRNGLFNESLSLKELQDIYEKLEVVVRKGDLAKAVNKLAELYDNLEIQLAYEANRSDGVVSGSVPRPGEQSIVAINLALDNWLEQLDLFIDQHKAIFGRQIQAKKLEADRKTELKIERDLEFIKEKLRIGKIAEAINCLDNLQDQLDSSPTETKSQLEKARIEVLRACERLTDEALLDLLGSDYGGLNYEAVYLSDMLRRITIRSAEVVQIRDRLLDRILDMMDADRKESVEKMKLKVPCKRLAVAKNNRGSFISVDQSTYASDLVKINDLGPEDFEGELGSTFFLTYSIESIVADWTENLADRSLNITEYEQLMANALTDLHTFQEKNSEYLKKKKKEQLEAETRKELARKILENLVDNQRVTVAAAILDSPILRDRFPELQEAVYSQVEESNSYYRTQEAEVESELENRVNNNIRMRRNLVIKNCIMAKSKNPRQLAFSDNLEQSLRGFKQCVKERRTKEEKDWQTLEQAEQELKQIYDETIAQARALGCTEEEIALFPTRDKIYFKSKGLSKFSIFSPLFLTSLDRIFNIIYKNGKFGNFYGSSLQKKIWQYAKTYMKLDIIHAEKGEQYDSKKHQLNREVSSYGVERGSIVRTIFPGREREGGVYCSLRASVDIAK